VLLAYYIAAINIEAVYHSIMDSEKNRSLSAAEGGVSKGSGLSYEPFEGICLTDTFQLYEKGDLVSQMLVDNSARRTRQKNLDIRVIIGNPPYSAGQNSANDNNANVGYPSLD
jgi:predicted helicase